MKIKSYYQRLFSAPEPYIGEYEPTFEVMSQENFVENGRCLIRSCVKTVDNAEAMSQYSPDDFRMENVIAVGATMDGKRYQYVPSRMDMMDAVNNAGEILNDIVDMYQNNGQVNEEQ